MSISPAVYIDDRKVEPSVPEVSGHSRLPVSLLDKHSANSLFKAPETVYRKVSTWRCVVSLDVPRKSHENLALFILPRPTSSPRKLSSAAGATAQWIIISTFIQRKRINRKRNQRQIKTWSSNPDCSEAKRDRILCSLLYWGRLYGK